jgi:wyosine [tRNA(Phe)-imidazoG37] synthetase (radical SAM superfamily)
LKYIYGPVRSRRLGASLGITTVPAKLCSFNCVYCDVARTTLLTDERKEYIKADDILSELYDFLQRSQRHLDHITFSGFGEPTLNSKIGYMINAIKNFTEVPLVVLTNSSLIARDDVKRDIMNADIVKFTLNAGNDECHRRINQPLKTIHTESIIKGIIDFRKMFGNEMWVEIMLVRGVNDYEENYRNLHDELELINADRVQINTVVREPSFGYAKSLTPVELLNAKEFIGNNAEIISLEHSIHYHIHHNQFAHAMKS